MNKINSCMWLRVSVFFLAVSFSVMYGYIIPFFGREAASAMPEFSLWYWPWFCFLQLTAVPCYIALVLAWKISDQIKNELSFSVKTAGLLKKIAFLAFADAGYFFAGNLLLFFLSMNHPAVFFFSHFIIMTGIVIALAADAMSRFVLKAAELQEQSDYTL